MGLLGCECLNRANATVAREGSWIAARGLMGFGDTRSSVSWCRSEEMKPAARAVPADVGQARSRGRGCTEHSTPLLG